MGERGNVREGGRGRLAEGVRLEGILSKHDVLPPYYLHRTPPKATLSTR
jgi:hypothetical protein